MFTARYDGYVVTTVNNRLRILRLVPNGWEFLDEFEYADSNEMTEVALKARNLINELNKIDDTRRKEENSRTKESSREPQQEVNQKEGQ
jgi:hypothetical protein